MVMHRSGGSLPCPLFFTWWGIGPIFSLFVPQFCLFPTPIAFPKQPTLGTLANRLWVEPHGECGGRLLVGVAGNGYSL